jgi:hypothetical protein
MKITASAVKKLVYHEWDLDDGPSNNPNAGQGDDSFPKELYKKIEFRILSVAPLPDKPHVSVVLYAAKPHAAKPQKGEFLGIIGVTMRYSPSWGLTLHKTYLKHTFVSNLTGYNKAHEKFDKITSAKVQTWRVSYTVHGEAFVRATSKDAALEAFDNNPRRYVKGYDIDEASADFAYDEPVDDAERDEHDA